MYALSRAVLFAEICFEVDSRNVLRSLESTVSPSAVLPAAPSKVVIKFLTLRRAMTVLGVIQGHSFKISVTHPLPSVIYFPPVRDTSVLSGLRTATRFTRPIPRTENIVLSLIVL